MLQTLAMPGSDKGRTQHKLVATLVVSIVYVVVSNEIRVGISG